MAGVCGVGGDAEGLPQTSLAVKVLHGWEGSRGDALGSFHHSLQGLVFSSSGTALPDCDAAAQNALHSGSVEVAEKLLWQVDSLQPSKEVEPLLCFPDDVGCVQ